jgi:hypothetical protein
VVRAAGVSGRSTLALAYLDVNGSATYDVVASWDPRRLEIPPDTAVLHTESLAIDLEPGASEVLRLCEEVRKGGGRAVVVDLNVHPGAQPDRDAHGAACMRLAGSADVVKASDEDLAWLFPGLEPLAAAWVVAAAGPRLVVVTLGGAARSRSRRMSRYASRPRASRWRTPWALGTPSRPRFSTRSQAGRPSPASMSGSHCLGRRRKSRSCLPDASLPQQSTALAPEPIRPLPQNSKGASGPRRGSISDRGPAVWHGHGRGAQLCGWGAPVSTRKRHHTWSPDSRAPCSSGFGRTRFLSAAALQRPGREQPHKRLVHGPDPA